VLFRSRQWLIWALKPRPWLGVAAVILAVGSLGWLLVNRTQRALAVTLMDQQSVRVAGPLKVAFSQDIGNYKGELSPKVPGKWAQKRTVLGIEEAEFTPDKRLEAGRSYTLRLTSLKRSVTGRALPDITQKFTAQTPAAIKTFTPATGSKDVPVAAQFTVTLAEPNRGVRGLQPILVPAIPLKLVSSDDRTFIWQPEQPLKQGSAYTFTLTDALMPTPEKQLLLTSTFTVVTAPSIVSARTGGLFAQGQTVDIVFDQPMDTGNTTAFVFDAKGVGSWTGDHTYRFRPTSLTPGKTYNYTVKAGLKSSAGGVLEADRPFTFATNGAVTASVSPGGTVGVNTAVRIAFNQAVDHGSAQARFSMSPAVGGGFSWSGNTMVYQTSGAAYQTAYHYNVAAGVVPAWGLPSVKAFGGAYSTETQVIKLGVPTYHQAYGRSCELASLRMLLAYRGISTTDYAILQRVGYNPRARDTGSNSWDNPNQMFVGFVDTFSWSQGYGVFSGPLAAAGRSYGRNVQNYYGVSAAWISSQVHSGNPVEFYGYIGSQSADAWNTSSGVVQTTTAMHARVIYGVAGSADNPSGFYIHDPWTATSFYWSAAQVMANMNSVPGVSNQAVVVY
jgi:uncharacterized protein YvpB